jgi:lactoylglutathione lyase
MGEILGFAHLAINTKDWERSLWFYGELLGFPLSAPVAMNGFSLTYAAVPGGGNIELFKNREVLGDRKQKDEATVGLRHFAFEVSGLQSLRDKLVANGVSLTLDITDLPALGIKVILFEDPNGVTLEFSERSS